MATRDNAIRQMLAAGMPEFPPGHPVNIKPHFVRRSSGTFCNLTMKKKFGPLWACAKLTDTQVLEILQKYSTGEFTQQDLADMYFVERSTIAKITTRAQWRRVTK